VRSVQFSLASTEVDVAFDYERMQASHQSARLMSKVDSEDVGVCCERRRFGSRNSFEQVSAAVAGQAVRTARNSKRELDRVVEGETKRE